MTKMDVDGKPLKIAVSACLLGQPVRYDGGHRRHDFVAGELAARFDIVALCPEVEAGMGVPRPTIQLVAGPAGIRALGVDDPQRDVSQALGEYAVAKAEALGDICGCVLKSRSPSCGLHTPVQPRGESPGLFARAMLDKWPGLPIVEDEALDNETGQRDFVARAVAYGRTLWV